MRYLLDTNIWILYLKGGHPMLRAKLEVTDRRDIVTCPVVWAELLYGARRYEKRSEREAKIEAALSALVCLPFDVTAARHYARVRDDLESQGLIIGGTDLIIASIALTHGLTVVTHNSDEFGRVPGLAVEDWVLSAS
jgi:tRNA(fMet)-specific endonuclease VapC